MSDTTKKLKHRSRFLWALSMLLNVVPMAVFVIMGFIQGTTEQKVVLGFTAVSALGLGALMILSKMNIKRSIFWILALGLTLVMNELYPVIIAMGSCTLLDELIVSPIHSRINTDYHTNKQIDKRLNE